MPTKSAARRALTQALYALRQDLGSEEAFSGSKTSG